jgi:galactokinase
MLTNPIRPGRPVAPPFIKPYLDALNRMQEQQYLLPEETTDRARALLTEKYGESESPVEVSFAYGPAGLMSDHTHYFDGFALFMPLRFGTGVAVRYTSARFSRVVFEAGSGPWVFDASTEAPGKDVKSDAPFWARVAQEVVRRLSTRDRQFEIAVVSSVPSACIEAYLSALGVAVARSIQALTESKVKTAALLKHVQEGIANSFEIPFSIGYVVAADAGRPNYFTLVDASNLEHLPLEAPTREVLGWGLASTVSEVGRPLSFYPKMLDKANEAVDHLTKHGYPHMTSLRDLDHSELQRALGILPRPLRPIVRYLVTENRRVNKMVFAVRNKDWQMFGALLLMSHASRRNDFGASNEQADFIVEQVEVMSLEGMYGASLSGRGRSVLIAGQPFIIPQCLDTVQSSFEQRFDVRPDVMLL